MTRDEVRAAVRARREANGTPARAGRPSLFTVERATEILTLTRLAPLNQRAVADAVGISEATLRDWVRRGGELEDSDGPLTADDDRFVVFAREYRKARGHAGIMTERFIQNAAMQPRYWTAAAWLLERSNPEVYGRPVRLEHSGPQGAAIKFSDDDRAKRLEMILTAMLSGKRGPGPVPPAFAALLAPADIDAEQTEGAG